MTSPSMVDARHLVGSDAWYLRCITKGETDAIIRQVDHDDERVVETFSSS